MPEYQVAVLWWPDGWEPNSPLDVPNCIGWSGESRPGPKMTYDQAVTAVQGLNRQNMDHPGATWYVVATEAEAAEGSADLQVVYPKEGGGRGDCAHCPARSFPCAAGEA
jgi:hypothetical protein